MMVIDFEMEVATDLAIREVTSCFANLLKCPINFDDFAVRGDLELAVSKAKASDLGEEEEIFGDVDITSISFRLNSSANPRQQHDAYISIIRGVVGFLCQYPQTDGLFAYRGEHVLISRINPARLTFDETWKKYTAYPYDTELDEISDPYATSKLSQPFV